MDLTSRDCVLFGAHIPAIWSYMRYVKLLRETRQSQEETQESQQSGKAIFICDNHLHLAPRLISSRSRPKHFFSSGVRPIASAGHALSSMPRPSYLAFTLLHDAVWGCLEVLLGLGVVLWSSDPLDSRIRLRTPRRWGPPNSSICNSCFGPFHLIPARDRLVRTLTSEYIS